MLDDEVDDELEVEHDVLEVDVHELHEVDDDQDLVLVFDELVDVMLEQLAEHNELQVI